eukprot:1530296-Amphidinium_carterae.1
MSAGWRLHMLHYWCLVALQDWSKHVHEFQLVGTWWQMHHIVYEIVYGNPPWDEVLWEAIQERARKEWNAAVCTSIQAWRKWATTVVVQNGKDVYRWLRKDESSGAGADPMVDGLPNPGHRGMLAATSEWWDEWPKHIGQPDAHPTASEVRNCQLRKWTVP